MGNALGAWLGGVTITAGLGYTSPIWAGAAITLLGLAVMAGAAARAKATARRVAVAEATVASQKAVETGPAGSVQAEPADVGRVSVR